MISVEDLIDAAKKARAAYQDKIRAYLREGNRDSAEELIEGFPSFWNGVLMMGHKVLRLRPKDIAPFGMGLHLERESFEAWATEAFRVD
jgi:hypothetical protein